MRNSQDIIKEEFEAIKRDVIALYEASGKKVSGEFLEGLEITQNGYRTTLEGYTYLAGRASGKMPPIQKIEAWVQAKGLSAVGKTQTALAWAIAKKIAAQGTAAENHLAVYDKVITPERIQSIIDKVSDFNVGLFTTEIRIEMNKLTINK